MITRTDIIVVALLIAGFVAYYIFAGGGKPMSVQRAGIEVRDSVIVARLDSAIARARYHEARADSLQRILDKQLGGIPQIQKKYNAKENHVAGLPADSSLQLFTGGTAKSKH